MSGKRIAITGVSGYTGRVLLPYLEQDESVESVLGFDQCPLENIDADKLTFQQLDVRNAHLDKALAGVDTLVHLAFVLMRGPNDDDAQIEAINVDGSQAVFEAAARQGVGKIIFTSSVVAYGLHPDNPVPLKEDSPLRPNPGLYYSRNKAAVEAYLDTFEEQHPEMTVTRLRPCTVVGPNADPGQMASLIADPTILVRGANPPYQLLHEDDLAQALLLAIHEEMPGIYNVTSDEPQTLRELALHRESQIAALPYPLVRGLMGLTWRLGQSDFAPEWADLVRYPIVADNEKLKQLGWEPEYTTTEALDVLVDSF
jgi:UDP-glucose 4-epimerase